MYIDTNVYTGRPTDDRIPQELAVYDRLEELNIPYLRVDHDHRRHHGGLSENRVPAGRPNLQEPVFVQPAADRLLSGDDAGDKPFKTSSSPPSWAAPGSPLPTGTTWPQYLQDHPRLSVRSGAAV